MAGVTVAAGEIPSAGKLTVQCLEGVASSNLALTSTLTDVPGASVTLTAQTSSAFYVATVSARCDRSAAAGAVAAIVRLDVDGSSVAGQIVVAHSTAIACISTPAKTFTGALSAGSHTFKIRGSCATSSLWTVSLGDTNLVVTVFG